MKRLLDILISERFVVVVILVNAAALTLIGYTDVEQHTRAWHSDQVFYFARAVDRLCVGFFVLEVLLKVRRHGWRGYWVNGWNRFDFAVTLLSLPSLVPSLGVFAGVSVFRVGRLFRLFRLMRFIPNRDHLYAGVRRALRASVGIFLALCIVNFVLSIGATFLFADDAPQYFGHPALSSYTLFRVFSVEGWYEIPDAIAQNASPLWGGFARLYFMASLLGGGVLGLSLANAIFVDEMTIDNNDDLERKVAALTDEIRLLRERLESKR